VVVGGVLWPLAALVVNRFIPVLALGKTGTIALLLATLAVLANLVLCPTRRAGRGTPIEVRPPRSAWLRALLLVAASWSCLVWAYLGLLMLPLLPISMVAILFLGLGLCGLTPFPALAVSLVQLRRSFRAVTERTGRRPAIALLVAALLLPLLLAASSGLVLWRQSLALEQRVAQAVSSAPHSEARLEVIASLRGDEKRLAALYVQSRDLETQRLLAESYQLLTDQRIHEAVWHVNEQQRALIRPLWFLDGTGSLLQPGVAWLPHRWRF
jgi:hypothetical protein